MAVKAHARVRSELRRLINGYQISQALHVVSVLGIPDQLADGPRSSDELAAVVGVSNELLYRLLRAVAAIGVLDELTEQRFMLTDLGEGLRSDVPGSLAGWAAFIGRRYYWTVWSRLIDSVRTGAQAFRLEHGEDPWSYRRAHQEEVPIFNRAMNSTSGQVVESVVDVCDFSRFGTVVDVGGGGGALITAILSRHPSVRGVLFDLPHVVADSRAFIHQAGLAGRCQLVGGSFFDGVPLGGDAYVLKSVLQDWSDEDVKRILRTCHAAMRKDALMLVVQRLVAPPNKGIETKLSDLNLLVAVGGRERTADEWKAVLRTGGFDLRAITPADGPAVMEASPA